MVDENKSGGDKVVAQIESVSNVIGTLVPAVASIGGLIRLIATAVRPTDAQKAQPFDAAIADLDQKIGGLKDSIAGFEQAKAQAEALKSGTPSGAPVSGMTTKPSEG